MLDDGRDAGLQNPWRFGAVTFLLCLGVRVVCPSEGGAFGKVEDAFRSKSFAARARQSSLQRFVERICTHR